MTLPTTIDLSAVLTLAVVVASGINVFVGLRLAALQFRLTAAAAIQEVALLKQFVAWKDEVLSAINGKYVSTALIGEIKTGLGHEMAQLQARMDRIERRCEERPKDCRAMHCQG